MTNIFIRSPKCGGTSLIKIIEHLEASPQEYKRFKGKYWINKGHIFTNLKHFKRFQNTDSLKVHSICRNPWERAVSAYFHSLRNCKQKIPTFKDFVEMDWKDMERKTRIHAMPLMDIYKEQGDSLNKIDVMYDFIANSNSQDLKNVINNIFTDFELGYFDSTKYNNMETAKYNSGKHEDYRYYFDENILKTFNEKYHSDTTILAKHMGYSFENYINEDFNYINKKSLPIV
jgi:hypothetical protein